MEEDSPVFLQSVFFSSLWWFAFNDVFISHHPPGGVACQAYDPCQLSDHANPISVISQKARGQTAAAAFPLN